MKKILDKFKGCLFGGAIGDALGYAIEFDDIVKIKRKHGNNGIINYEKANGSAIVSDDTQMTMFTAAGIIVSKTLSKDITESIYYSYLNWLETQGYKTNCKNISWLSSIHDLYFRRAPGNTCLSSLKSGKMGTLDNIINDSKGCGGVMRVAPVGLFFSSDINNKEKAAKYGCEAAAITHGHDMGYLSAGLLSLIIFNIINNKKDSLKDIIVSSNSTMLEIYGDLYIPLFDMICNAIDLTFNDLDDITNISDIGKGWVGDEAIAIAVYCAVKYSKNFKKAIIASVNHSGDSDSTGAITGNIVGCFLGYKNIPKEYLDDLELKIELDEISNDLYDCSYNFEKFINRKNTSQKYLIS